MEEMLDIFTRDGKYLGIKTRAECHTENPGFYHKPAWTWVYNSKNEILVQKRALSKKRWAGYWDMSCAGHVDAGETPKQGAMREAKEEIGLEVNEDEVKLMFEHILDEDYWEIGQVFFIKVDKELNEFTIKKDEVEELKWVSFEEFKNLLYSDKWSPSDIGFKDLVVEKFEEIFNLKKEKN